MTIRHGGSFRVNEGLDLDVQVSARIPSFLHNGKQNHMTINDHQRLKNHQGDI